MSSKSFSLQIKQRDGSLLTIKPKVHVDGIKDFQQAVAGIIGYDFTEVMETVDAAEEAMEDIREKIACTLNVPKQSVPLVYNGSAQSPSWDYYSTRLITITGTTSATNAGTYNATVTPTTNSYNWNDTGNSNARTIHWTIAKKDPTVTLSASTFSLTVNNLTKQITVTSENNGTVSAVSSHPNKVSVSVSGNTVTLTGNSFQMGVDIAITVAGNSNYNSKTVHVTGDALIVGALSSATPDIVQVIAQKDLASSYWSIGDWFPMTLNGSLTCTDTTITFSNYTIRCELIGINHNASKEGNHRLHFQMGKNTSNVNVAFYSSKMKTTNDNTGGWASCAMRTTTLANLYNNIIPSNWRAVIVNTTKYTDNTGGTSQGSATTPTTTTDKLFLLSEFEIFGTRKYANTYEQSYQAQYAYYANGNTKVRYRHDSTGSTVVWFTRSPYLDGTYKFCDVRTGGDSYAIQANSANAFVPCFAIG